MNHMPSATHTINPMSGENNPWRATNKQQGLTIFGLVFWVALLGSALLLGMKVLPIANEYFSVKKAVKIAKSAGDPYAIRSSFDQQSKANYVDNISARDLIIETENGMTTVEFVYQRVVPLVGPVNLLFKFSGKELVP